MQELFRKVLVPLFVTFVVLAAFVLIITFFSGVFDLIVYFIMDLG